MTRYNPQPDIADLQYELRERGFSLYCAPMYYAKCVSSHGHMPTSRHFVKPGHAIDTGRGAGGVNNYKFAHMDVLARELHNRGFRCIWNRGTGDHQDHVHIDDDDRYAPTIRYSGVRLNKLDGFGSLITSPVRAKDGDRSEAVKAVQERVQYFDKVKVDGVFGPRTEAAVKAWQAALNLDDDGVVGGRTVRADLRTVPNLRRDDRNSQVRWVQLAVGATADGVYGPKTEAAVRKAQAAYGLTADGIFGAASRSGLIR